MSRAGLDRRTRLAAVTTLAARLGADELELLHLLTSRLCAGQARYGALDVRRDPRDFRAEALEELVDGTVYLAAELLRRAQGRAQPPPVTPTGKQSAEARVRLCALPCASCAFCGQSLGVRRSHARYCRAACRAGASRRRRASAVDASAPRLGPDADRTGAGQDA